MKPDPHPTVQVWDCDQCKQTYRSPIRLSVPPTHHCGGSSLSTKNRPFKLRDKQRSTTS